MNSQEALSQFKSYYNGGYKTVGNNLICSAKNPKDLKIKMQAAWHHITARCLNMLVIKNSNNSFTVISL